ncbi:hypothetical protein DFH09DRAFT_1364677 [Mycena vulgaris]|nr:hypothetical protein DFH09DRAFT_1364677 [Mycena vulgaris]
MLAAEAAFTALHSAFVSTLHFLLRPLRFQYHRSRFSVSETSDSAWEFSESEIISLYAYSTAFPGSRAHADPWAVLNVRPGFATPLGLTRGVLYAGHGTDESLDDFSRRPRDAPGGGAPIAYAASEPPLSTDLISSVALTGTTHA